MLELPELGSEVNPSNPDLTIRIVEHPSPSSAAASERAGLSIHSVQHATINLLEHGEISVEHGHDIAVMLPRANGSIDVLRGFLVTTALNVALFQRGLFTVHASVIGAGDFAVAFAGDSGQGKSSLAAVMQQRGYSLLADDLLVLDTRSTASLMARPGVPQIKLMPDAAAHLGIATEHLPDAADLSPKRVLRLDQYATALPLRCIYILETGSESRIEPLGSQKGFWELLRHSYAGSVSRRLGSNVLGDQPFAAEYLGQCSAVVEHVPIRRLIRRWSLSNMPQIIEMIEHDLDGVA